MVAWHEMPGKRIPGDPSRRVRYDQSARVYDCLGREQNLAPRITPFPPGRVMFTNYPGISCLATFIESLRDNNRRLLSTKWTPHEAPESRTRTKLLVTEPN